MAERTLGWVADDSHHVKIPESVEGKKATRMVVTDEPPSHVAVNEEFLFGGYLEDADGNRLAGKTVVMHAEWDGNVGDFPVVTPPSGTWWLKCLPYVPQTVTQYAYFEGDAEHEGSRTPTYTTVVS